MIQALIFDFDGLIVDTELPDFRAWQAVYREHGAELSLETWGQVIGQGFTQAFEPVSYLEKQVGRVLDREALQRSHTQRYEGGITAQPILPGVEDYLADARRLGLRLAVASSSPHAWVDAHLERLGLMAYFDGVRCRDDVTRVKPAPDLFLAALEMLAVEASAAIVFEDSPHGVTAAKSAGIFCVAVPNELTRQVSLAHADLTLDTLADLPLAALLARVNDSRS